MHRQYHSMCGWTGAAAREPIWRDHPGGPTSPSLACLQQRQSFSRTLLSWQPKRFPCTPTRCGMQRTVTAVQHNNTEIAYSTEDLIKYSPEAKP